MFASIEDVSELWRPFKNTEELNKAESLIEVVEDTLRYEAKKVGKNLDKMVTDDSIYATVVKSVVVDIVARMLMTSTAQEPMTQSTESALGYSWSGSFLVPGGGLFIKNSELSRLGLRRQRYGAMEIYDIGTGSYDED